MEVDIFGAKILCRHSRQECEKDTRIYKKSIKIRLHGRLNKYKRIYRIVHG